MGMSPHHPTIRVWGSVVSSSSGVRGGSPAENGFYAYLRSDGQKEAIWNTLFSIFERWRGPQNVAGPGKTPHFPPLDGPAKA